MKHNLLKSVIISVILLMGVSNAYAETIMRVYCKQAQSWWKADGAAVGAYAWKSTNTSQKNANYPGVRMSPVNGQTDLWYADIDIDKYDRIIFTRVPGSGTVSDWGAKTGDLTIKNTQNQYTITQSSGAWNGATSAGSWSTYKPTSTASLTASPTSTYVDNNVTLTPALTSNKDANTYSSTAYTVNPATASVNGNTFTATTAGTYTVTATVTYYAKGCPTLTSTTQATAKITVEAQHSVTISYKCGNNNIQSATTSSVGESTSKSITAPTITGYKFSSWTLGNGITNKSANTTTNPISITTKSSGTYTLTANYTEDLTSTWHIVGDPTSIFHGAAAWAAHDDNMLKKTTGASTASKGSLTIDVKTLPASNDSYQFKVLNTNGTKWYGWSNSENYWVNRTNNTTNVYNADNNNLYFIPDALGEYKFDVDWSSSNPSLKVTFPTAYTVTFGKGTGGSSVTAKYNSTFFNSGTKVQSGKTVTFTQSASAGYTFKEWNTKSDGKGTTLSTNATYTHTVATTNTVYAIYTPNKYTVKFNPNGGTGSMADQAFIYGTEQNLTANAFTNVGYSFNGWNTNAAGTGTKYADKARVNNLTTTNNATVNLYAQWEEITYAITYKDQGDKPFSGTHESGYPTQHTYNTTTTLLGATKSGYTFAGWYRDSECAGARVETLGVDITEAITLYAKWDVASYTINFDLEGGTGGTTTELTVPFGAQLPNITIPTKAGYLFLGYYNGDDGTGTQYYDTSGKGLETMPANNLTLHAKWLNGSDCIFFYNNLGWSNVYVYFYNNAAGHNYWADGYGTGANKQQKFWENNPYFEMEHGTMTQIKGTNIWYYYATYIKTNQRSKVSFANVNQSCDKEANNTNSYFQNAKVVYRADLDYEKRLPMFVPHTTQSHYFSNTRSTYYNHGYWMNYPENTGYKLHIFDENGNKINDQLVEIPFEYGDNTIMPWSVSVSLEGATTYAFKIQRADDTWYGNNGTMTTNSSGDAGQTAWEFTTGTNNCKITTTAPGTYVFTLNYGKDRNSNYNYLVGVEYPASVGDYRLAYKDNTHPFHPGHLLKKRAGTDIVSFFVHYNENPVIMLQKVNTINANTGAITWDTLKTYALIANQPVGDNPGQAMISGRRNADEIILHIGDEHMDGVDATGIYNFVLEQTDSEATLQNTATKYTGNFYIRTDATAGGWGNFRQKSNQITYTSYAENQDFDFNHYFVEWINAGTNVKFTIANDYSYCLSDTLDADDIVTTGNLPANANVRFGWNSKTNELSRAYIAGSSNASDRFLVLEGNEYLLDIEGKALNVSGLNANEAIFSDKQNWIYQLDVQANNNTEITLTAKYNKKVQTFFGTSKSGFGGEPIMQATNDDYHKVRMIYDFKTNNLIAAWLLDETQYPETTSVASNMLIIREDQRNANQINFKNIQNQDMEINTAYAVMTFTKDWVTGAATRDRSEYWVSFPFDVKISDVFGFSEYGDKWIMQLYDGAERAEKGNWIDSPTFWKYITNRNYTLKAGVGYVLKLNLSKMTFDHGATDVSLFFPSQGIPTVINAEPTPITVPAHECTIERDNRNIYDSHWNLIGVPGYANLNDVNTKYTTGNQAENVSFYYAYNAAENNYAAAAATADFKNMYAYMVQFAGTIDWKNDPQFNNIPQQLAARHNSDTEQEKRTLRLEIAQGEEVADRTFVQLKQEGATANFDLSLDLTKIMNSGFSNIYTLTDSLKIQVAGNALPMEETVVPVGVNIAAAGEYTFRMPDGTEGMVVELIDYEANTTTNLLLDDYTVNLPAGSNETRFALSIKPEKTATNVGNIGGTMNDGQGVRKFIIDGKLYLQKDGMLYDAQGHIVR